jgi:hypothetical protein
MRRYAEGTPVTVNASQGEIARILTTHGVKKQGWLSSPDGDELMFELGGHSFRFPILKPTIAEIRRDYPNTRDEHAKLDGEWRRRWRANVLLLKAKLEFIDSGDTTLERELLPYMLTANGQTVGDLITAGKLPMLESGKQ